MYKLFIKCFISSWLILGVCISIAEANWSMNYPMNGNTLYAMNTTGTGNTPTGSFTVTYRNGKYNGEEFRGHFKTPSADVAEVKSQPNSHIGINCFYVLK